MRIPVQIGGQQAELEIPDDKVLHPSHSPVSAPITDLRETLRAGLEQPQDFPALRRALTPDDHVTIVVDDRLPNPRSLVEGVVEHLALAGVKPECVTLVLPPSAPQPAWIAELSGALASLSIEVHDPANRSKIAYLAATKQGNRIYINRSVVDADQLVVLACRRYDAEFRPIGVETLLYPTLSDAPTLREVQSQQLADWSKRQSRSSDPARREADEVVWLLGVPFVIQVIADSADRIAGMVCGTCESRAEADQILEARWHMRVAGQADTVVVPISDVATLDADALVQALVAAERVVKSGGRIVLLAEHLNLDHAGLQLIRECHDPQHALRELGKQKPMGVLTAYRWANVVANASVYIMSDQPADLIEELFATPLDQLCQVRRLAEQGTCLVFPDAHKGCATLGD